MINTTYYNLKVKIFKRFPWRVQSLLKFRPTAVIQELENFKGEVIKKRFPINLKDLKMPIHAEENLHENFKKLNIQDFHKYCSDFFCAQLFDAQILDNNNVVTVIKNNKIIESLSFDPLRRKTHPSLSIFCYPKPTYLKGKTLLLSTPGAQNNYFHFTIDLLQKIGFAMECGFLINDFDNILVNKLSYKFQRELLEIFGIPQNKITETQPDSYFDCEQVVIPSHSPHSYFGYSFVRTTVLNKILSIEHNHSKRIYISRKNASGRRIVNEDELINFITPLGFETIYLESLTVREQTVLFNNAEIVITPHGAGTTNILYSNRGTSLIEIHDIGAPLNVDFYPYLSYGAINYGYMFAQTVANPATTHFNFQDIVVDISKLKMLMDKMNLNL